MKNFVAIDFETANFEKSSVCSVGICIVQNGEIVDNYYSLIRPVPNYYCQRCQEVHGLGPSDTNDAPEFPEVWAEAIDRVKQYFPNFPKGSPTQPAQGCGGESRGTSRPNDCGAIGQCDLVAECEEVAFIAHNKACDESCLKAVSAACDTKYPDYEFDCTLLKSRKVWPEGHHNLDIIASYCGYNLKNHHHALADAEACAVIGIKIL